MNTKDSIWVNTRRPYYTQSSPTQRDDDEAQMAYITEWNAKHPHSDGWTFADRVCVVVLFCIMAVLLGVHAGWLP